MFKGLVRNFLLILIFLIFLFVVVYAESKREILKGIIYNASKEVTVDEKLLQEIENAYKLRDYERVVSLHQKIPPLASLSAEEFLLIAESYYLTGNFDKALDLAERASSLRRGTEVSCKASLLKVKVLYLRGKEKEAQRELKALSANFCAESFAEEISALQYLLFNEKVEVSEAKLLKSLAGEINQARFYYYLKGGKLKEAESALYNFVNLGGEYVQAKSLFFKLAEAYLAKGDPRNAKRFYQLIVTEWDYTKEAFLSKFRLYQLTYERATVKELLPAKTVEDLLMYITQIKTKYPGEPIAEEASFLGIKIFFQKKDWEKTRERAKEFLANYPQSSFSPQVFDYYCQATTSLVPLKFLKGEITYLTDLAMKEEETLREAQCGTFYYLLGKEFFNYRLWRLSAYFFLQAYDLKLPENYLADYYLKLAFLAEELKEKELGESLFRYLSKRWGKTLRGFPEYLYLLTKNTLYANIEEGYKLLEEVQKSPLPSLYKEELYQQAFYTALEKKKYSLAYNILKTYFFKALPENYLVLLVETFSSEPKLFETILEEAKTKFPQNPKILWLEAYHLERKGDLQKTPELWKRLEEKEGIEGEVARQYKTIQDLMRRAQKLVY